MDPVLTILVSLVALWALLVLALLWRRPPDSSLQGALRLLPDVLRLVTRLARDRTLPRGVRVRLGLLLAYLAMPIDLVPDFVPVLGYADDVIVIAWALRSVLRQAGAGPLAAHWPGTDDGLAVVLRLAGRGAAPDRGATSRQSRTGRSGELEEP